MGVGEVVPRWIDHQETGDAENDGAPDQEFVLVINRYLDSCHSDSTSGMTTRMLNWNIG